MAQEAHLYRVGQTFYFRVRFPADLKSHFKRDEIKRSLRTKSKTSARQLLKLYTARTEEVFTMLRTNILTNTQIKELIEDYITYTLEKNNLQRVEQGVTFTVVNTDQGDVQLSTRHLGDPEADYILDELKKNRYDLVSKRLDEFLTEINTELDYAQYKTLCNDLSQLHVNKIAQIDCDRDLGDYSDPYHLREWRPEAKNQQEKVSKAKPEAEPQGLLLSELISLYIKENVTQGKWTTKTSGQNEARLNLMLEIIGDCQAKSIERDSIVDCLEKLQRMPLNRSKKYPGKTVAELLALNGVSQTLGVATVRDHMGLLSALLKWALRLGYLERNVAEGVSPKDTRATDEQRAAYSTENLQKLYDFFCQAPYSPAPKLHISEEEKWIVLTGMYTGARLGEVCQLYREDIYEREGVWCFEFSDLKDKKVKTKSSGRIVPVHQKLIELGFLKYHSKVNHERLFPSLKKGPDGYSSVFQKKFSRINRKYITDDKAQVYHSLRHSFTNTLKQAGLLEQQIGELVGHKSGSLTMERYGKKYEPKVLLDAIKKLDYELSF